MNQNAAREAIIALIQHELDLSLWRDFEVTVEPGTDYEFYVEFKTPDPYNDFNIRVKKLDLENPRFSVFELWASDQWEVFNVYTSSIKEFYVSLLWAGSYKVGR